MGTTTEELLWVVVAVTPPPAAPAAPAAASSPGHAPIVAYAARYASLLAYAQAAAPLAAAAAAGNTWRFAAQAYPGPGLWVIWFDSAFWLYGVGACNCRRLTGHEAVALAEGKAMDDYFCATCPLSGKVIGGGSPRLGQTDGPGQCGACGQEVWLGGGGGVPVHARPWAVPSARDYLAGGRQTPAQEMAALVSSIGVGTTLLTKDGRHTGNAVVYRRAGDTIDAVTDYGNDMVLTPAEVVTHYHIGPEYHQHRQLQRKRGKVMQVYRPKAAPPAAPPKPYPTGKDCG